MRKLFVCLVAGLMLASCNPQESAEDLAATPAPETTESAGTSSSTQKCEDREPDAPEEQDEMSEEKPEIEIADGAPPCELVIQDIVEGDGDEAKEGDTLSVHYVGASWSTGEEFDASWTAGQPIELSLMQVIPGWQQGIPGMKEGGQRQLIIPPDLAYGDTPPPGSSIAPGETLVFIIGLVKASGT
jgi:peptidylprolyl isomerase